MISRFIDSGYFDLLYIIILVSSVLSGYCIARYRYIKKQRVWKISGTENGIIGFYGLLISFILVQSGNSNRERTDFIHQHCDALATIHQETLSMPDSIHHMLHEDLVRLLEFNLRASDAEAVDFQALYIESGDIYRTIWTKLGKIALEGSSLVASSGIITEQMHRATALNYRILYSHKDRTPAEVMVILILGSWIVGLLVGFTNGFNKEHHFLVPIIFTTLAGLTLLSIRDLDNPTTGMIRPSYESYRNLLTDLNGDELKNQR
jgi:hypothetical protein